MSPMHNFDKDDFRAISEKRKVYDKESDYKPANIETEVLEWVENGIKAVELTGIISKMMQEKHLVTFYPSAEQEGTDPGMLFYQKFMPAYEDVGDITRYLMKLVNEGKIVELEYELPHMDYRIKSMYFLAGTKFTLPK